MIFKWPKKNIQEYDDNIFRLLSKKTDSECKFLTQLNFQNCYYEKCDDKKNIIKRCFDFAVLEWESIVYLYLVDKRIAPLMTFKENNLYYETSDKISLYEYIRGNNPHIKFLLNELFGFVSKFRNYNFLHGNLHVHNVFINPDLFIRKGHFYVIDYSNSFLLDKSSKLPKYQRSSFIGEMDKKITSIFFEYWDFFTLYTSLKLLLKSNLDNISYLDGLIENYVNKEVLARFIEEYNSYNDSNIVLYHLNNNPSFVDT
jgi:hypothetical protein